MKKLFYFLILGVLCLSLISCGSATEETGTSEETNTLENTVYYGTWTSEYAKRDKLYSRAAVKFSEDGVVEWVHITPTGTLLSDGWKIDKYYGTYKIDGRTVTVALGLSIDVTLTCIIHDDGDRLTIGGEDFTVFDPSKGNESMNRQTLNQFD